MKKEPGGMAWLKAARLLAAAAAAVSCALPVVGCGGVSAGGKLKVAASIAPLADFCRQVGGDLVEVELMVPSGASPHSYEPTIDQMKFLAEAELLVLNGLELESWTGSVLSKAGNPGLVQVETAAAIPREELIAANAGEEDSGVWDPHVWLDPQLAAWQVGAIRDALAAADPDHARQYRDNASSYLRQLEALDTWTGEATASFTQREFVAFHSSWTYFAQRYGLDMAGVVEELPGKEPSASQVAELIDTIRSENVTVIFAEPQFSTRAAEAIAQSSGGEVEVVILDPLGNPDDPALDTYDEMMRHNVEAMGEALR